MSIFSNTHTKPKKKKSRSLPIDSHLFQIQISSLLWEFCSCLELKGDSSYVLSVVFFQSKRKHQNQPTPPAGISFVLMKRDSVDVTSMYYFKLPERKNLNHWFVNTVNVLQSDGGDGKEDILSVESQPRTGDGVGLPLTGPHVSPRLISAYLLQHLIDQTWQKSSDPESQFVILQLLFGGVWHCTLLSLKGSDAAGTEGFSSLRHASWTGKNVASKHNSGSYFISSKSINAGLCRQGLRTTETRQTKWGPVFATFRGQKFLSWHGDPEASLALVLAFIMEPAA